MAKWLFFVWSLCCVDKNDLSMTAFDMTNTRWGKSGFCVLPVAKNSLAKNHISAEQKKYVHLLTLRT